MVGAFAWYLLDWRKKVTVRVEPDKVKEATAMYRRQNDLYRQFIEECIVDADATIALQELYSYFKDWFKEGWPNMALPIKNQVKDYFEKLWGTIVWVTLVQTLLVRLTLFVSGFGTHLLFDANSVMFCRAFVHKR
jgi:hypothetical protein